MKRHTSALVFTGAIISIILDTMDILSHITPHIMPYTPTPSQIYQGFMHMSNLVTVWMYSTYQALEAPVGHPLVGGIAAYVIVEIGKKILVRLGGVPKFMSKISKLCHKIKKCRSPHTQGKNYGKSDMVHQKHYPQATFSSWPDQSQTRQSILDEYAINSVYETKSDIRKRLGLSLQGINPIKEEGLVILFGNTYRFDSDENLGCDDSHDVGSDIYTYTGEGQCGDQRLTRGNMALIDAMNTGMDVYLFWGERYKYHRYVGKVQVIGCEKLLEDVDGKSRYVFRFKLRAISEDTS